MSFIHIYTLQPSGVSWVSNALEIDEAMNPNLRTTKLCVFFSGWVPDWEERTIPARAYQMREPPAKTCNR